jgi:hypothetical protein
MLSELKIDTDAGRTAFLPGEILEVTAGWKLRENADAVELRLLWHTHGEGEPDMNVVEKLRIEPAERLGTRHWAVQLPNGPYSFIGSLVSLEWSLELMVEPSDEASRLDLTIGPQGKAIELYPEEEALPDPVQ